MMRVTMPWPPAPLSPNSRQHWAVKARAARNYRSHCHLAALAGNARNIKADGLALSITFCPPGNQRRDLDNMLAAIKSGLDGLSQATGIDDSKWTIAMKRGEWTKGGAVIVDIAPI